MFSTKISSFTRTLLAVIILSASTSSLLADESGSKAIAGSWIGTITATDPPGLPPMKNLFSFMPDGVVIESRRLYVGDSPFGPLMETAGHGEWVTTGKGQFTVKFVFLIQRGPISDGSGIGTDNITLKLTLDESGNQLSGTFVSEIRDENDNVMFVASGVSTAKRIRAPGRKD
jgi:hypothetical protein